MTWERSLCYGKIKLEDLEFQGPDGNFIAVVPRPGTFVINVGDMLERWSNDVYKSTKHHTALPSLREGEDPNGSCPSRRSIAYFCNPDRDAEISVIPHLGQAKYEPVIAGDWYAMRLGALVSVM